MSTGASNVQGQDPPQPPPNDPNQEVLPTNLMLELIQSLQQNQSELAEAIKQLKEKDAGTKTLPQNEGGNQEKPHQDSGSHEKEATFVTMSDVANLAQTRKREESKGASTFWSALVHISKFIDSMGAYVGNGDLCLREFSKSLDDRAYTCARNQMKDLFEEPPPPVPCTLEEMMAILNKWVADGIVKLPENFKEDCWTLRRKFHEKIQDGTLELPQARQKVHIDPFLKHKEKGVVSVVIHGSASDADMDEPVAAKYCHDICSHQDFAKEIPDEDMEVQYPDHRRPLYLSATINEVQVRRALVDTGSCINLIPLSTIQAAEISQKKIQGAPMEIKGFGGVGEYTKGHIQLVLKHQLIPSTYHQCVKGRLNGKPIRIAANSTPFDQSESHFVEAALYDEITPAGEASLAKPIGIPLPKWEEIKDAPEADLRDLLERKKKRRAEASTSKSQPQYVPESADTAEAATADPKISAKEELENIKMFFAWQYDEMPGIDPKLVAHSLNVEPGTRPVVQPMRTFHPEVEAQITQEVKKLLSAGFIKPIQHPRWLSNIVPVKKKNGQIRCCVDFRNLNKACPKDEFPLPNMDLLIDSAAGHAMDAEKTAFRTPIGNFYYTVMPFGLKNARATYQRTMTAMFHDMMHREIEDYVDDIVVKSKTREDHFGILKKRGIDVDPARASAIATMKPPTTHKELKSFLGKLSYIRRFISGLAAVTSAFAPLLKKGAPFHWSTECQEAFEKPQEDDNGVEQPVYYVSRTLKDAESRYSGAERSCLALIYASQRLLTLLSSSQEDCLEEFWQAALALKKQRKKLPEVHEKTCGDGGAVSLYRRLQAAGIFLAKHECRSSRDTEPMPNLPIPLQQRRDFVKTCHTCQVQANLIHTHPTSLQNMATPWPFHTWGLDLIGPINPASGGYIWILVATEYFTKWVEAIPLRKATGAAVANFIREHIITRFGIPYKLISDNGTPFINKDVREVLEHYRVKHRRSTPYYPQGNGQAEATNRMLLRILSKMVFDYGNDWKAHLADVLWAYRSSPKTATGFTPFSLVYGHRYYFSY
uniref:RNA-directed DNA polymerase n=1 Tax=Fagus sylvatica TaxID=28930 RepID=A0A2N9H5W3_FAGSY